MGVGAFAAVEQSLKCCNLQEVSSHFLIFSQFCTSISFYMYRLVPWKEQSQLILNEIVDDLFFILKTSPYHQSQ